MLGLAQLASAFPLEDIQTFLKSVSNATKSVDIVNKEKPGLVGKTEKVVVIMFC